MPMPRPLAVALALMCAGCAGQEPPAAARPAAADLAGQAASRGRDLAAGACARCHAIDTTGASPLAAAPPFREIVHRRALDQLGRGFAEGLTTTHPAMPRFAFRASEIDDLIAYLETLKAEP